MLNSTDGAALAAAKNAVLNSPNEPERRAASNNFRQLVADIVGVAGDGAEVMAALINSGDAPLDGTACDALIDLLDRTTP